MRTIVNRSVLVAALFLPLALSTRSIVAQQGGTIRDPDAYAVYASLLPARFGSDDTDVSRVAVLEETKSTASTCLPELGKQFVPGGIWASVLESYKKENARVYRLLPGFNLGLAYTLVSTSELRTRQNDPGLRGQVYSQFPNQKLLSFSAVGFDNLKTHALVSVQYDCGFNCDGGWILPREKDATGHWVLPRGVRSLCQWVA